MRIVDVDIRIVIFHGCRHENDISSQLPLDEGGVSTDTRNEPVAKSLQVVALNNRQRCGEVSIHPVIRRQANFCAKISDVERKIVVCINAGNIFIKLTLVEQFTTRTAKSLIGAEIPTHRMANGRDFRVSIEQKRNERRSGKL